MHHLDIVLTYLFTCIRSLRSEYTTAESFGDAVREEYEPQVYMSLPNNGSQPKSYELPLHGLSCNGLCVSVDGRSLVTVGEDGVEHCKSIQFKRLSENTFFLISEDWCLIVLWLGGFQTAPSVRME